MPEDHLLSVSTYPFRRVVEHLKLFSRTGDLSKPGSGTTLLTHGGLNAHPELFRSPAPVLDATKPSFHLGPSFCLLIVFAIDALHAILPSPGEAEAGSAGVQPAKE